MRTKSSLLFIFLIGLIGCLPEQEPVAVTRPVVVTEMPTVVNTAVPPTSTPPPTATQVAAATAAPTNTPLPTSTPEPAWPTTPILFVRDNILHRWLPQTNEVELLAERVDSFRVYAPDIAVFMREVVPQETYALIVFHIPTQTEVEIVRLPAVKDFNPNSGVTSFVPPLKNAVTVSPNSKWIGFVSENDDMLSLTLHELVFENSVVDARQLLSIPTDIRKDSSIYLAYFSWNQENQLSWSTGSGIWELDLANDSVEPKIIIQPSLNTYNHPGSVDENGDYLPVRTRLSTYRWSPDGRYLIAREAAYEGGAFRIIERETDRTVVIPDAYYGAYSDALIWITNDSFIQFNLNGTITHWQVQTEEPFSLAEITSFQFERGFFDNLSQISGNHIRFSYSLLSGPATSWIYDLNFETGEFTKLSSDLESREIVVYWTPNNEEILWQPISGPSTSIYYDSLDGQPSVNLDEVFGTDSCCWYWERTSSE